MLRIAVAVFIILHGLVHIWYIVLAQRLINIEKDMGWTGKAGLAPALFGDTAGRWIATGLFAASTAVFVIGGAGVAMDADWLFPLLIAAALLSSLSIALFWDGRASMLMEKGFIGLLVNVIVIVAAVRAL